MQRSRTIVLVRWGELVINAIFQPYLVIYMAGIFHSWRNKLFLEVNHQPSVSSWQLPLMEFEPKRRRASSFKEVEVVVVVVVVVRGVAREKLMCMPVWHRERRSRERTRVVWGYAPLGNLLYEITIFLASDALSGGYLPILNQSVF